MTTKAAPGPQRSTVDVKHILARPLELVLDDAVAYWLEDDVGHRLDSESDRSLAPLFLTLELSQSGRDPDVLLLCARLETGERFELGGGPSLINVAVAAAGLPRRPRALREA